MMKRDLGVGLALAIALAILLSVNLGASIVLGSLKADLTDERLYTLSSGSKLMLKKLDDSVKVKIFYSKRPASSLPSIKQYADRTTELLRQYESHSSGKLKLEQYDPRPDTEVEEAAIKYGLKSIPVAGDEPLFFGLVAVSETGVERAIPFLDPQREELLEYDLSRLIAAVSHPEKKKVGVMSSLNVMGGAGADPMARLSGRPPAEPWVFISELKQTYDVQEVKTTVGEIDKGIDLLVVIHPKKLPEQAEYAIDQYILNGGKAIILIDTHSEYDLVNLRSPNPQARFQESFDSNLPRLMKAWGIDVSTGKALADADHGTMVNYGGGIDKFPHWLSLSSKNCNQQEIVSTHLEKLQFASAAGLTKAKDCKYQFTPLIFTSPSAGEIDSFMLKLGPNPKEMTKGLTPMNQEIPIAVKLTGKFETAFPEGKPKSVLPEEPGKGEDPTKKKEDEGNKNHLAQAAADGMVIVVGDADFLADDFSVRVQNMFGNRVAQVINDNLNFMNNAVEMMTGSTDLINLRTRGKSARPFTKVDQLESDAQKRFKAEEEQLQATLDKANQRISQLQGGKDESNKSVLTQEQMKEIENARKEMAETRKKLREVKRKLRQDIESLGSVLQFVNIGLAPFIVLMLGFVPSAWRSFKVRSTRG